MGLSESCRTNRVGIVGNVGSSSVDCTPTITTTTTITNVMTHKYRYDEVGVGLRRLKLVMSSSSRCEKELTGCNAPVYVGMPSNLRKVNVRERSSSNERSKRAKRCLRITSSH